MYRLIAVTTRETAAKIAAAGPLAGERLTVVEALGLATLLLPRRKQVLISAFARKATLEGLLQDQKALEAAQAHGPLLAAAQAPPILDQTEALGLIAAHADMLRTGLAEFGAMRQFQITVAADPDALAPLLAAAPTVLAAAGQGPAALAAAMAAMTAMLAEMARAEITRAARDVIDLPVAGASMLLNLAAMIGADEEARLDEAVEAVDAMAPDALAIRYVGPLPAISFAALTLETADGAKLGKALGRLGLKGPVGAVDLRAAYLERAKASHPDAGGDGEGLDEIKDAFRLLSRVQDAEAAQRRAGAPRPGRLLLLDLKRDGDPGSARRAA
jgi:hypothetical protein